MAKKPRMKYLPPAAAISLQGDCRRHQHDDQQRDNAPHATPGVAISGRLSSRSRKVISLTNQVTG